MYFVLVNRLWLFQNLFYNHKTIAWIKKNLKSWLRYLRMKTVDIFPKLIEIDEEQTEIFKVKGKAEFPKSQ